MFYKGSTNANKILNKYYYELIIITKIHINSKILFLII